MGKKHKRYLSPVPTPPPTAQNGAPEKGALPVPAQIEKKIEEALQPLPLPPQQRSQAKVAMLGVFRQIYSGPLPRPEDFADYEAVLPGAAERIVSMAEKEQKHRHDWEGAVLRTEARNSLVGLIIGGLVAVGLVGGVIVCAVIGATALGSALVAASAVSMVPAFINGRRWPWTKSGPKNGN